MVAPYTGASASPQPDEAGTAILIPVTNAVERLHEEFKRRIKTQTVLPRPETAAMLVWVLLASGQITCARSTAGRRSPNGPPAPPLISLPDPLPSTHWRDRRTQP